MARLLVIRENLIDLDAFDCSTAKAGLAEDLGTAERRLRRYETALRRRLDWCLKHLERTRENLASESNIPAHEVLPLPEESEIVAVDDFETLPLPSPMTRRQRRIRMAERRQLATERRLARKRE